MLCNVFSHAPSMQRVGQCATIFLKDCELFVKLDLSIGRRQCAGKLRNQEFRNQGEHPRPRKKISGKNWFSGFLAQIPKTTGFCRNDWCGWLFFVAFVC